MRPIAPEVSRGLSAIGRLPRKGRIKDISLSFKGLRKEPRGDWKSTLLTGGRLASFERGAIKSKVHLQNRKTSGRMNLLMQTRSLDNGGLEEVIYNIAKHFIETFSIWLSSVSIEEVRWRSVVRDWGSRLRSSRKKKRGNTRKFYPDMRSICWSLIFPISGWKCASQANIPDSLLSPQYLLLDARSGVE